MPIRMEKDSNQENPQRPNNPRGGSSLLRWLPFILMFLIKRPKLIVPALLIGGIWYFFLGGSSFLSNFSTPPTDDLSNFSFGATLDQERFDQAQVFEPLSYGYGGASLPSKVSLEEFAPTPAHQGRQGSCVGWASAYAARTILHSKATGRNPNQIRFSPSYLYNQIALTGCQGAYMLDAMKAMRQNGSLPFNEYPYNEATCSDKPNNTEIRSARQFKINGYNRLTVGASNYKPDILAIKQNLAQGAPVVIGMQVGGTFMSRMIGYDMWKPTRQDYGLRGFSGHAMCVIGYDDDYSGGAFHIMNSWGREWGNQGNAWVTYRDFEYFVKEAYGLHPMGNAKEEQFDPNKMAVEFGLVDISKKTTIALKQKGDMVFQTVKPIGKGDKFKVLVANSIECYMYIFGQETDGSSYVLFPYPVDGQRRSKYSAYCGITGTRLFPRDLSLTADDIGTKDLIAIVVSKEEIDFFQFNDRINNSRQRTYVDKVREALGSQRINTVNFQADKTVSFDAQLNGKNAVGMIVEIDKR